jgi:hypothetical protein
MIYIYGHIIIYVVIHGYTTTQKKSREVEHLEMIGMLDVLFTFWKHDSIYLGIHESELWLGYKDFGLR